MQADLSLIGIGLYSVAEASRLVDVPSRKIARWLRGHTIGEQYYEGLWRPQISLGGRETYLGFRDLLQVRVANAFIEHGISAQRVRKAICLARDLLATDHPLATARFRTDGRSIFLQVLSEEGDDTFIDLFKRQYAFRDILEPSLKNIEFDQDGLPFRWWPKGKSLRIVIDPARAFGRPIEAESGIPSAILAAAAAAEGSIDAAARAWSVSSNSVKRAIEFEHTFQLRKAA
jgi:uncharacterized protein (DUF433 family)